MPTLTLDALKKSVRNAFAIRGCARLQPAGGKGDKILPPTYAGSAYAVEMRRLNGEEVKCILVDSVQSQANRMEMAILEARDAGRLPMPLVTVRFPPELVPSGRITSLDAPHRVADAILRDSTLDGKPWRDTKPGKGWIDATPASATGLYNVCPVAVLLGVWDSTGSLGTSGTKFPRVLVSEMVAINACEGVRTRSRIDSLAIKKLDDIYAVEGGGWTLDQENALTKKNEPVRKKPSELNHGNVTPDLIRPEQKESKFKGSDDPIHGGITCDRIEQSIVLSMSGLRRLSFPDDEGRRDPERDIAARTALAALGLAAVALSREAGFALRSRCDLVPEALPWVYESLRSTEDSTEYELDADAACNLLNDALAAAKAHDIAWSNDEIELTPRQELVQLVRRTREGEGRNDEAA